MSEDTNTQQQPVAEEVTLKSDAIDHMKSSETPEQRKERLNISDLPYHTHETEKAAEAAAKDVDRDKPYKYEAHGYTVTEDKVPEGQVLMGAVDGKIYRVVAGDFEKVFTDKRQAEIYVESHSAAHKDLPATISKE